ncbi:hypothetical protein H1R20_g9319, partial [Candolleomyces eurysporus]
MAILNSFFNNIFERIATKASELGAYAKQSAIMTYKSGPLSTSFTLVILPSQY